MWPKCNFGRGEDESAPVCGQEGWTMITCERLTVGCDAKPGGVVLRNLTARIPHGQVRAIVGGEGSGKTVLGSALRGALGAGLTRTSGSVHIGAFDPLDRAAGSPAEHVAWLGEDPEGALDGFATVRDAIAAVMAGRFPGWPLDDLTLVAALARFGMNDAKLLDRDPATLDAGLRRRVALAQALARPATAQHPKLVVLDEPLLGLDSAVADEVVDALAGMRRVLQASVVLLTRDLALAQRFADEISVLEGGQIIETFTPERAFSAAQAVSLVREATNMSVVTGARVAAAGVATKPRAVGAQGADRAGLASDHTPSIPALELREFSVVLPDGQRVTPPISVELPAGGALAITGGPGSGKSMLAQAIVGGLRPSSALRIGGQLLLSGEAQEPRAAARTAEQRRAIQLVVHDPARATAETHTVRTHLRRVIRRTRPAASSSAVGTRALELLSLVGVGPELLIARMCDLSSGQALRIAIARALAHDPSVLMCEGPRFDRAGDRILALCADVRERADVALVLITSSRAVARAMCDRELRLDAASAPRCIAHDPAEATGAGRRAA